MKTYSVNWMMLREWCEFTPLTSKVILYYGWNVIAEIRQHSTSIRLVLNVRKFGTLLLERDSWAENNFLWISMINFSTLMVDCNRWEQLTDFEDHYVWTRTRTRNFDTLLLECSRWGNHWLWTFVMYESVREILILSCWNITVAGGGRNLPQEGEEQQLGVRVVTVSSGSRSKHLQSQQDSLSVTFKI